jgi:hypothetical protein
LTDILEVELKISEIHHFPDMDPKECVVQKNRKSPVPFVCYSDKMFETRKLFKIPENTPVPPPESMQLEIKLELMQKQTAMTVAQTLHILNLTMNNEAVI